MSGRSAIGFPTAPPVSRRAFLTGATAALGGAVLTPAMRAAAALADGAAATGLAGWHAPADHVPHDRTWMAWPARSDIWGQLLPGVRADVASIARTIAGFEPVSMVARPDQAADAAAACGDGVDIVVIANDDLWMRDIGPVFLADGNGGLAGLDLNFNGWGHRQVHHDDAKVARKVLEALGVPRIVAPFVSEGGALETDGAGTAMATESSVVNPNRNPGKTKAQLASEIRDALGVRQVLWVPGLADHDITDDHIDSLARFVTPGRVVVDQPADPTATDVWATSEREALHILRRAHDARGVALRCTTSRESATIPPGENPNRFVNVYVNWYVCNGAVLIPSFADPDGDDAAHALVTERYPGREVVQLRIDHLAAGGGGIHCVTQQQPAV